MTPEQVREQLAQTHEVVAVCASHPVEHPRAGAPTLAFAWPVTRSGLP